MTEFSQFPIYKVTVQEASGRLELITFLSPQELDQVGGLAAELIVGKLLGPGTEFSPANFARNRAFVDFLHGVIRNAVPEIQEYVDAARRNGSGWLHIHDARAFHFNRELAATDIIGSFRVEDGTIQAETYTPNPEHRILGEYGVVTPHPEIQRRLLAAMRALRYPR